MISTRLLFESQSYNTCFENIKHILKTTFLSNTTSIKVPSKEFEDINAHYWELMRTAILKDNSTKSIWESNFNTWKTQIETLIKSNNIFKQIIYSNKVN